jgi:hypothetical protein
MNVLAKGSRFECQVLSLVLRLFGLETRTRKGLIVAAGKPTISSELLRAAEEAVQNENRLISWYIRREAAK